MTTHEEKKNRFPVFQERFKALRGDMNQAEFAQLLGIARPTVGFYENGERLPDALVLKKIADKCNVSIDWLLGMSEVKSTDENEKIAAKTTGLTEESVRFMNEARQLSPGIVPILNKVLCSYNFYVSLESIKEAIKYADEWKEVRGMRTQENTVEAATPPRGYICIPLRKAAVMEMQRAGDDFRSVVRSIVKKRNDPKTTGKPIEWKMVDSDNSQE